MRRWTRNEYVHCWTRLPEVPLHFQGIIRHTLVVSIKKPALAKVRVFSLESGG